MGVVHFDTLHQGLWERLNSSVGKEWTERVIADTGSGMPECYPAEIFDLFFTTKEKGIGLGLAIVYRIIESYRGIIEVASEDNKGSRFTIYLPSIVQPQGSML